MSQQSSSDVPSTTSTSANVKKQPQPLPLSPARLGLAGGLGSPSRLRSSSPRLHSPASSEIFERNVQEPVAISSLTGNGGSDDPQQAAAAQHIPSHVVTEDLIPPALEASAQAITSDSLNPDEVEIVTSSLHQPAATTLEQSATSTLGSDFQSLNSPISLPRSPPPGTTFEDGDAAPSFVTTQASTTEDETASNYGQLDPNDVRRLSFISFKDVVQSEHQQAVLAAEPGARESLYLGHAAHERAASPLRSPTSTNASLSGGVITPPAVGSTSHPAIANAEGSPARLGHSQQHGELTIETMRQALRKTASGDLGGRNAGLSPTVSGSEDASLSGSFLRESTLGSGLRSRKEL